MKFVILPGFTMDRNHKDIIYLVYKLKEKYPHATFRFLDPPVRPISIYNNQRYRAWYDYYTDKRTSEEDINELQLLQSRERIHRILNSFKNLNDVYLLGYSQGCCTALDSGLTYPRKLGGIIGIKGHIPSTTFHSLQTKQPIWVTHGKKDKTIGYNVAKQSYDKLLKNNYPLRFVTLPKANHSLKSGINVQLNDINHSLFKTT